METSALDAAAWIGTPLRGTAHVGAPSPRLRAAFRLGSRPRKVELLVTALGVYEAEVDGRRVGDAWLAPGWTDYDHRLHVQRHDLTGVVGEGEHVLGVTLGDGWYAGRVAHFDRGLRWGERPLLRCALRWELENGDAGRLVSGPDWHWSEGPIRSSDLIDGEHHDARRETPGWSTPAGAGSDAPWLPAAVVDPPAEPRLVFDDPSPPVRVVAEVPPVADPEVGPAAWGGQARVFDFGQNLTGVVRLRVRGRRGLTLRLRFAEVLAAGPDANSSGVPSGLDASNLRSARVTDGYTLRGDPAGETWTPRFTFHGFRYCEISWTDPMREDAGDEPPLEPLNRGSLTALVLANDLPVTGTFTTGHTLLGKLHENIGWGLIGNFLEAPTDCPQRDERLGWTGDIQVFAPTATFHRDVSGFLRKWMRDVADAQVPEGEPEAGAVPSVVPNVLQRADGGPGWSDAAVVVPWAAFRAYGNREALAEAWPTAERWMAFQRRTSRGGFRDPASIGLFPGFGDWLALDGDSSSPLASLTPLPMIATAYFAHSLGVFARIAGCLGHDAEAEGALAERDRAAAAFTERYLEGGCLTVASQTAHLLALGNDLLPEAARPAVFEGLLQLLADRDGHLSTGFLGTPLLCPVLDRFGRTDLAMDLLLTESYPGWLYPVTLGATTMWERWNSWHPERGFVDRTMNSLNHYAYGSVGDWIYRRVAGLDFAFSDNGPDLFFRPHVDARLGHAGATLETRAGRIESHWSIEEDATDFRFVVPAGVEARWVLPGEPDRVLGAGEHRARVQA